MFHKQHTILAYVLIVLCFTVVNVLIFARTPSPRRDNFPKVEGGDPRKSDQSAAEDGTPSQQNGETDVGGRAEAPPPQLHYRHNITLWPYSDLEDMLKKTLPSKSYGPSVDDVEPTRRLFIEATGCDPFRVPFEVSTDAKCIAFLTDLQHWKELAPMNQLYDERTIKFQVVFRTPGLPAGYKLKSILKVPQKLFPTEPFGELAAFHADRVMQLNRIPPTGWVCIPTKMIRDAVKKHADRMDTVPEFLEESGAKNFADWVERDLFQFAADRNLVTADGSDGACIGASIQLHVADANHLLDSVLAIPYIPHNASWHDFFNLHLPKSANALWSMHSKKHRDDDDDDEAQSEAPDQDVGHDGRNTNTPVTFMGEPFAPSLLHISEVLTFDYVIGNNDRSPNKNNFVVGGCARSRCKRPGSAMRHPQHPTYVHLDQGMAFNHAPSNNPITKCYKKGAEVRTTFCIFRAPLLNRLAALLGDSQTPTAFEQQMQERVPKNVLHQLGGRALLRECAGRIKKVLALADACLKEPFGRYVIAP